MGSADVGSAAAGSADAPGELTLGGITLGAITRWLPAGAEDAEPALWHAVHDFNDPESRLQPSNWWRDEADSTASWTVSAVLSAGTTTTTEASLLTSSAVPSCVRYNVRASVALGGLGAIPPEDAVYSSTPPGKRAFDAVGEYRMVFRKGQLPPCDAFWSLTLYDQSGFPVPNDIGRHAVGSPHGLLTESDGSVVIHIQHTSPGKERCAAPARRPSPAARQARKRQLTSHVAPPTLAVAPESSAALAAAVAGCGLRLWISREANWLPSPATGSFCLTGRYYLPRRELLNRTWQPPPVERLTQDIKARM